MKKAIVFFSLLILAALSYGQDEKPAQEISISSPRKIATLDQKTGKLKLERGVEFEEVANVLMNELIQLSQKFDTLNKECKPEKPTAKGKP